MKHRLFMATLLALPMLPLGGGLRPDCEPKIGVMGPMYGRAAQWGLGMNSAAEWPQPR